MSYLESLAELNWSEWRILPTENMEEPLRKTKSRLNITSKELDQLATAVESLGNKRAGPHEDKALRTIAKKCWHYLKEEGQKDPIHISFFPHRCLLEKCNKVYKQFYPHNGKSIPILCKEGVYEISSADFEILKRESALNASQLTDIARLKITPKILEKLLVHLSDDRVKVCNFPLVEYLDLVAAASLLEIDHLQQLYLTTLAPLSCKYKQIAFALENKLNELTSIDKNIFENKMLLNSFQRIIQYFLRKKRDYNLPIINWIPWNVLKFGNEHSDYHTPVSSGLPDIAKISSLEHLEFHSWRITKEDLCKLQPLKNLRKLYFNYCRFSKDALEVLSQFSNLESLKIKMPFTFENDQEFLSESIFMTIGKLSRLKELYFFRGGKIQDEWLKYLSPLKLEILKINRISQFTGSGLKYLHPGTLKFLKLEVCWELTVEGTQQICSLSQLKKFVVSISPGSDDEKVEKVEEAIVDILPNLPVTELKLNHRQHISPSKVYSKIRPEIKRIEHFIEFSAKPCFSSKEESRQTFESILLERKIELTRWKIQGDYPSPRLLET